MIPCYITHGSRHRINNKSIQEEYKIWVLVAETFDFVVQFKPYQGAKKRETGCSKENRVLNKNGLRKYTTISDDSCKKRNVVTLNSAHQARKQCNVNQVDNRAIYIAFSKSCKPKGFVRCWNKVEIKYRQVGRLRTIFQVFL